MNLSPYLCALNGRALVPTFSGLIHKFKPKHELVVIRLEILQGKLNRCHHIHITNPPTSVHILHLWRWGQAHSPTPRGNKDINCSSHYVCGEFAVAANGLILLENVDERIHFSQTFADGSPHRKFSQHHALFIYSQCLLCAYGNG